MRYFFPDPDNSERLIKTPPHTVEQIRADALREAAEAVKALPIPLGGFNARGAMVQGEDVIAILEALGEQQ